MKLNVIDTPLAAVRLQANLADQELIAFDTETTGVHKGAEIIGLSVCADEEEAHYIIIAGWNKELGKLDYLPGMRQAATDFVTSLVGKQLICHNGVFDCMMVENFFKVSLIESLHTDTMVLAHLLDENRRVGLKELGKALFGQESGDEAALMKASVAANGGTLTKANYEMYKADPQLMAKYGAQDARLTYKLFLALVPELYAQGLEDFFYTDESMPLLKGPTYELNATGLKVDGVALTSLKKQLEAECLEAKAFIYSEITPLIADKYPPTGKKKDQFNLGSTSQLSWLLFGKLELEFNTLTKEGKAVCKALGLKLPYTLPAKRLFIAECIRAKDRIYQPEVKGALKTTRAKKYKDPWGYIACDKDTLKKLAPKYKWIEKLTEYQKKMKLLSTYVEGIEARVHYGVIHPSFLQTGTSSGRYSSRNPNFQNLPRDDKRIKECIIARPGKVFVGADYSQLEPRVFAYYSKDVRLLAAFNGENDFYSVIGREVFDKMDATPQKEGSPDAFGVKYKKLRDATKVFSLASVYGASAFQLAKTVGKSEEATQEDMDAYFERFPGVPEMMLEAHELAKTHGFVANIFGRKRRIPEAQRITKLYGKKLHADLPYEARSLLNLSVNHRIQSTGASIVNRAAIAFTNDRKQAGIDARLVCQVHDSLIVECNEADADNILILLENAMINTVTLEGVQLEALPKIGKNLAEV